MTRLKREGIGDLEILSNVVYGVVAHPLGLLSGLLGFGRFQTVDKTGTLDDFGQLFGPV